MDVGRGPGGVDLFVGGLDVSVLRCVENESGGERADGGNVEQQHGEHAVETADDAGGGLRRLAVLAHFLKQIAEPGGIRFPVLCLFQGDVDLPQGLGCAGRCSALERAASSLRDRVDLPMNHVQVLGPARLPAS